MTTSKIATLRLIDPNLLHLGPADGPGRLRRKASYRRSVRSSLEAAGVLFAGQHQSWTIPLGGGAAKY
jgi:hypothetical protein